MVALLLLLKLNLPQSLDPIDKDDSQNTGDNVSECMVSLFKSRLLLSAIYSIRLAIVNAFTSIILVGVVICLFCYIYRFIIFMQISFSSPTTLSFWALNVKKFCAVF